MKKKKFWQKKRFWIMLIIIAAFACTVYLCLSRQNTNQNSADSSSVMPVDDSGSATQYYSGVVKAQDTVSLQKDSDRTVKDIYVSEGDPVKKDQKLYSYDTSEDQNFLDQAKLELASAGTDIADFQNQIADLTSRKNSASDTSERSEYEDQIKDLQVQIRQSQLNQKTKQLDIDHLNQKISDATVTSPIGGVIKSISLNSTPDSTSFMTILSAGTWQIEGTVDEMNLSSLSQNMKVVIHSRVNSDTWDGTIVRIDTEPVKSDDGLDEADNGEASRYHFYVSPDKSEGLLLGQHVYLEVNDSTSGKQPADHKESGDDPS